MLKCIKLIPASFVEFQIGVFGNMPKISNVHNLPERMTRLLSQSYKPNPNRMGVTGLIDSPRIRSLLIERYDDIEMDISDMLSTLIGISVHEYSESKAPANEDTEHKLTDTHDSEGKEFGITLVGKADNYIEPMIIDIKTKATGFEKFGMLDIEEQLNVYAYQRRKRFQNVDKLVADIIYRNWKLMLVYGDYPPIAYKEMEVPLWTFKEEEKFIWDNLNFHKDHPYDCPDKYRWKKNDTFAVKNKGAKKALRVLDSEQEAESWIKTKGRGDSIEHRKGGCLRCDSYCNVRSVCRFSDKCIDKYKGEK